MELRPYDATRDRAGLWALKRAFERELGAATGDDRKAVAYDAKLTSAYRTRYLDWVEDCVAQDDRCVMLADTGDSLSGYAFTLPESFAIIWDGAVLNEIYVRDPVRGSGLADRLIEVVIELARDQSLPLDRLILDVGVDNERAQAFYERHGFDQWSRLVARPL